MLIGNRMRKFCVKIMEYEMALILKDVIALCHDLAQVFRVTDVKAETIYQGGDCIGLEGMGDSRAT